MKLRKIVITDAIFFKMAFFFSICLLLFIAIISYRQLQDVNDAQALIIQSRDRQIELEKLSSKIKDAERMQRGYIITGDSLYWKQYNSSMAKALKNLESLKQLYRTHPARLLELDKLDELMLSRFFIMDKTLRLQHNFPTSTALKLHLKEGSISMNKIERLVESIFKQENISLHRYESLHYRKNKFLPYTTGFPLLFSLIILAISFYKINYDNQKLLKMNDDLVFYNKSYEHAERLAKMGHWERNLETEEMLFSDNLFTLLGYEPNEFKPDSNSFLQLIHPNDREAMAAHLQDVKDSYNMPVTTFRAIRKDGQARCFSAEGSLGRTAKGTPIMIGVTVDITKEQNAREELEKKNRELEAMVDELASFNHIASHDLQEPLRKIQMFISRIARDEEDGLPDIAREYFLRIKDAALRMQMLITDLLLYSETGKAQEVFETTDLNKILNEAKQEISAEIEAKNAVIAADVLPTIPVIPFQIRQLLVNLLGNSIKYCNDAVTPYINLTCQIIHGSKIEGSRAQAFNYYYKFTVTDNGIGFKQEFADRIFELFHRLHKKDNYSGTGIGLAICKKIMENHNGFITAIGNEGEGATFIFYLPK
jgi:PAS domain S-box-containing protein